MRKTTALLAATLSCGVAQAQETQPLGVVETQVQAAHDGLSGQLANDRAYGADVALSVMARPMSWRNGAIVDGYSLGLGAQVGWTARMPEDADATALQPHDVAPNGYLYGGLRAELLGDLDRFSLRYAIGATGANSKADALYGTLGDEESWVNAAESEIAQNIWLTWERSWFITGETSSGAHLADVSTQATTALGERRISQSFSLATRMGWVLGPLSGTSSLDGEGLGANAEAYVHARAGIDLVAHDALIDGPFFNNDPHPHDVERKAFVPFAVFGVMLRPWRTVGLGYALELRGADAELPPEATAQQTFSPPVVGRLELIVNL